MASLLPNRLGSRESMVATSASRWYTGDWALAPIARPGRRRLGFKRESGALVREGIPCVGQGVIGAVPFAPRQSSFSLSSPRFRSLMLTGLPRYLGCVSSTVTSSIALNRAPYSRRYAM